MSGSSIWREQHEREVRFEATEAGRGQIMKKLCNLNQGVWILSSKIWETSEGYKAAKRSQYVLNKIPREAVWKMIRGWGETGAGRPVRKLLQKVKRQYICHNKKKKKVMRQRPSDTNSFKCLFLNGSLPISLYLSKLLTPWFNYIAQLQKQLLVNNLNSKKLHCTLLHNSHSRLQTKTAHFSLFHCTQFWENISASWAHLCCVQQV